MNMKIFVSYTLRDGFLNTHDLKLIEKVLISWCDPYIDLLHNQSRNPQKEVISVLEQSSMLLACLTPGLFSSKWVQLELKLAAINNIPIMFLDTGTLVRNAKLVHIGNHFARPRAR
jgi:hypothetical protein